MAKIFIDFITSAVLVETFSGYSQKFIICSTTF